MTQHEPTYYEILGIEQEADQNAIQSAYRRLAKTTHPDAGGTESAMAALTQAYRTLRDPIARLDYDQSLTAAPNYGNAPAGRGYRAPASGYATAPSPYNPATQHKAVREYVWSYLHDFGWLATLGGLILTVVSFQPVFGTSGWIIGIFGTALLYWVALQVVYVAWPELKLSNYRTARAPYRAGRRALRQLVITSLLWLPIGLVLQILVRLAV